MTETKKMVVSNETFEFLKIFAQQTDTIPEMFKEEDWIGYAHSRWTKEQIQRILLDLRKATGIE